MLCCIPGANESYISKASKKLKDSEQLVTSWSPALHSRELDNWLWKDETHLSIKKLWDYLSSYLYLTRLKDSGILLDAIREGIKSKDYFGYATSVDQRGHYLGLSFGAAASSIYLDISSVIVKRETALNQLALQVNTPAIQSNIPQDSLNSSQHNALEPIILKSISSTDSKLKRFHGTIKLDPIRLGRDIGKVDDEILQHLKGLIGSSVDVTLEISAEFSDSIPEHVIRTVQENCRTLKFKQFEFEEQ